jgi:pimeloyl-ACP methyl ester carboxylesterase
VRVFASEYGDRVAGLVLVDASHEDQEHDAPAIAPIVPFLSSIGALRLVGISFGLPPASLPPSVREFAEATRFRAAGHRAAADEIVHVRESAAEVRATRRKLNIPVVVVSAGRGADTEWRNLQRDQVSLSERGCQIIAEQSGHVVGIDQPQVVVDAVRSVVDEVRGQGRRESPCRSRVANPAVPPNGALASERR